ncbi:MAG: FtsX-like permease family protein [Cytophagales bacterium]|nr:FtsX-like permease family protein [Bernardetiaceae bacterium]MDW8210024.1 FtsX-like permease family protein [Cytophagales bacterium]
MLAYALLSLARKWRKYLFTLSIYAFTVAVFSSAILFSDAVQREAGVILHHLPELWVQRLAGGRLVPIEQTLIDSLRKIRGIKSIHQRTWGYWYDAATGAVFTLVAVDTTLTGLPLLNGISIPNLDSGQVIIGSGVAQLRNLQVGDFLALTDVGEHPYQFEIVGQFPVETSLLTRDMIALQAQQARKILQYAQNQCTDIAIRIHNPLEVDNIGRKIDWMFPSLRVVTKSQLMATYQTLFGWRGGLVMYAGLFAFLSMLVLAWERAAGSSTQERYETAVLKACGWHVEEVLRLRLVEAFLISFSATGLGIILAWGHVFIADAAFLKPLLAGWSVLYPSFHLQPYVSLTSLFFIILLSVVPYLVATLVPAWRSAIADPAEIMH